ncbi:MAG: bifunctional UDP-sugar hydrolase/5'-nucleotidase, partial [Clostridia bacterium]|nr:bifunctional UDP-sugar hydrolase/5'-nucleotidase [Clostridia bacterium]
SAEPTPGESAEPTPPTEKSDDIVIFYTNDVHCGYENYPKLATLKKAAEAAYNNVILVDAGDSIQGAPIGTISTGEYMIDIMNYVGYDVSTIGNHEFDYGMTRLFELITLADFPFVAANFMDLTTDPAEPVLEAYKVIDAGDVKVAFVGIATPESLFKSTPTYFQDENGDWAYGFAHSDGLAGLVPVVQAAIDAAAAEVGADGYVIALGHMGVDESSSPWTSTELIAELSGLDAFIDGHSHTVMAGNTVKDKDDNDVILTQTGTKLANVGKMVITADGITTELIALGDDVAEDADTKAFIDDIVEEFDADLQTVVAHTDYDLVINDPTTGNRIIRSRETNLGDLCADAYRAQLGADIAFVNGGGIRATIAAGDITYGQVLTVHPYGNMACLVEVTGQQILDALEWGAQGVTLDGTGELGGFLQVSGITYTIDPNIPSGVTRDEDGMWTGYEGTHRVSNVLVGGVALDLTKTYTLASHNYMLKNGGDGYAMFGTDNVTILRDEVMIDNQVLINYLQQNLNGEVTEDYSDPYGQGRITILSAYDYYVEADKGYEADFEVDENGYLVYNVKLSDLGDEQFISALEFAVFWNPEQLEIRTSRNGIALNTQPDEDGESSAVSPTLNNDADVGWTRYAIATSYGMVAPEDGIVLTLKFKVKDGVEDGTQIDIRLDEFKLTLVDKTEANINIDDKTVGTYDGYIIAGDKPVDKSALITLDTNYDAIMADEDLEIAADGMNLPEGTPWLTQAQHDANVAALAAAQAVIDDPDATQEEVDAAYDALLAAFQQPAVVELIWTTLNTYIEGADEFREGDDYLNATEEEKAAYEAAIAAALALLDNPEATQYMIDKAVEAITSAIYYITGETATYLVFAGIAILAILGLALVVRRRYNH